MLIYTYIDVRMLPRDIGQFCIPGPQRKTDKSVLSLPLCVCVYLGAVIGTPAHPRRPPSGANIYQLPTTGSGQECPLYNIHTYVHSCTVLVVYAVAIIILYTYMHTWCSQTVIYKVQVHTYTFIQTNIHIYTKHTCIYIYPKEYIQEFIHIYIYTQTHFVHIYTHTFHTYLHTYMHTHTFPTSLHIQRLLHTCI